MCFSVLTNTAQAVPVQDCNNGINSILYLMLFCASRIILIIFNFLKNIIPYIICSFCGCFFIKLKIKQRFDAQIFLSRKLFFYQTENNKKDLVLKFPSLMTLLMALENLTLRISKFMTLSIKIKSVLWQ